MGNRRNAYDRRDGIAPHHDRARESRAAGLPRRAARCRDRHRRHVIVAAREPAGGAGHRPEEDLALPSGGRHRGAARERLRHRARRGHRDERRSRVRRAGRRDAPWRARAGRAESQSGTGDEPARRRGTTPGGHRVACFFGGVTTYSVCFGPAVACARTWSVSTFNPARRSPRTNFGSSLTDQYTMVPPGRSAATVSETPLFLYSGALSVISLPSAPLSVSSMIASKPPRLSRRTFTTSSCFT